MNSKSARTARSFAFSSSPDTQPARRQAADDDLETRLGQAVARQLAQLGARDPQVIVERRHELARSAGGKLKLVIADPATNPVHTDTA